MQHRHARLFAFVVVPVAIATTHHRRHSLPAKQPCGHCHRHPRKRRGIFCCPVRLRSVRRCRARCRRRCPIDPPARFHSLAHHRPERADLEIKGAPRLRNERHTKGRGRAPRFCMSIFFSGDHDMRRSGGRSVRLRPVFRGFSATAIDESVVGDRVECARNFPGSSSRASVGRSVGRRHVTDRCRPTNFFFFWLSATSRGAHLVATAITEVIHITPRRSLSAVVAHASSPRFGARRPTASFAAYKRLHRTPPSRTSSRPPSDYATQPRVGRRHARKFESRYRWRWKRCCAPPPMLISRRQARSCAIEFRGFARVGSGRPCDAFVPRIAENTFATTLAPAFSATVPPRSRRPSHRGRRTNVAVALAAT